MFSWKVLSSLETISATDLFLSASRIPFFACSAASGIVLFSLANTSPRDSSSSKYFLSRASFSIFSLILCSCASMSGSSLFIVFSHTACFLSNSRSSVSFKSSSSRIAIRRCAFSLFSGAFRNSSSFAICSFCSFISCPAFFLWRSSVSMASSSFPISCFCMASLPCSAP